MQTATAALRATLAKKNPTYKKVVELYRRYWNGSAYVYGSAQDITDQVVQCGRIMWKLDKEDYGVFNLDNTTITFRNDRQQWKQGNPKGYFPTTYILNQSKIRVKIGAQLADGTFETLYVFTGYVSMDPVANPAEKTISVTLYGAMSIFENFNAEEISNLVTNEVLGSASGTVFTTDYNGVGLVASVIKGPTAGGPTGPNATELIANTDYNISGINVKGSPLTVTLVSALVGTETLWITYRYWHTDKNIEWIVEQIMTLCGISSYSVSKAIFSTNIENTYTTTTKTDWDAGTITDINTESVVGSIIQEGLKPVDASTFVVGSGTWNFNYAPGIITNKDGYAYAPYVEDFTNGTFCGSITYGSYGIEDFFFISSTSNPSTTTGYFLRVLRTSVYQLGRMELYRSASGTATLIGSWDPNSSAVNETFRIIKTGGNIDVYVAGTLRISAADGSPINASSYFVLQGSSAGANSAYFIDLYSSTSIGIPGTNDSDFHNNGYYYPTSANWISPVVDTGADLSAWGVINPSIVVPSGTSYKIETSVSADISTWDAWVELSGTGAVLSDVKRYIKIRVTFYTDSARRATCTLASFTLYYYTSTTPISLVNLTGLDCKAALEQLARMCNYEIGFNAADYFIFRPRTTTLPSVINLTSADNLEELTNVSDGVDKVYNRVKAEFGTYRKVADATGDALPNSITKYGTREYSISGSQLLPAENSNMAYSVAPTILAYTKTPRRRCSAPIMLRPDLELGDKANLAYEEPTALKPWKWGDTSVKWGQADIEYHNDTYKASRLAFWKVDMRIEGLEIDPETFKGVVDLTEALTEA